jgi:hypothetical protein
MLRIRIVILIIIAGLIISGLTAFPLLWELNTAAHFLIGPGADLSPANHSGFTHWILRVREGLENTYREYPFIAYGTDWLAFGHLVIAMFFVLPLRDPVRYRGVICIGIIASLAVIPLALICGPIRGIPFYWCLIDCSFGLLCLIPLFYTLHLIKKLPASSTPPNKT